MIKKYYIDNEKCMMMASNIENMREVNEERWKEEPKGKLEESINRAKSMKTKSMFNIQKIVDILQKDFKNESDIIIKLEKNGPIIFENRYTGEYVLLMHVLKDV